MIVVSTSDSEAVAERGPPAEVRPPTAAEMTCVAIFGSSTELPRNTERIICFRSVSSTSFMT